MPYNATSPIWHQTDDYTFNASMTLAPEKNINAAFYWDTAARGTPTGVYLLIGFVNDLNYNQPVFRTAPLNVTITK